MKFRHGPSSYEEKTFSSSCQDVVIGRHVAASEKKGREYSVGPEVIFQ